MRMQIQEELLFQKGTEEASVSPLQRRSALYEENDHSERAAEGAECLYVLAGEEMGGHHVIPRLQMARSPRVGMRAVDDAD